MRTPSASPPLELVLVGGGLANGLLAYRLARTRPELSIALLERGSTLGGNHTWSFHTSDIDENAWEWVRPFVGGSWTRHSVHFPGRNRELASGYHSIRSETFHARLKETLGSRVRLGADVLGVEENAVDLADGTRLRARAVIDGRGFPDYDPEVVGFQKFLGLDVRLDAPHGLRGPILMDARCEQRDGFRFFYVLPWSETRLLIEDTRYSDSPTIDATEFRDEILRYARRQDWRIAAVEREEAASLPIPLVADYATSPEPKTGAVGVAAGLFHPTTGYSLPDAVRLAEALARRKDFGRDLRDWLRAHSRRTVARRWFYRYLNRMLFLGAPPAQRYRILQRFYELPAPVVERFYAARLRPSDCLKILAGEPPIPVHRAIRCLTATGRERGLEGKSSSSSLRTTGGTALGH